METIGKALEAKQLTISPTVKNSAEEIQILKDMLNEKSEKAAKNLSEILLACPNLQIIGAEQIGSLDTAERDEVPMED